MKLYKILVLTPATIRPSIFRRTYRSFDNHLFRDNEVDGVVFVCGLHVDPVGRKDTEYTAMDIKLSANRVLPILFSKVNYKGSHSLSSAFKWLWDMASTSEVDYVFYLEDDWELTKYVDIKKMIRIMEEYPKLATLRLPFKPLGMAHSKNWAHFFPWNGSYFHCPETLKGSIGWCGHPSLVRMDFIKETNEFLTANWCPERQMKIYKQFGTPMGKVISKWDYGVYGYPAESEYVKDIGRVWRTQNSITKLKNTSWEVSK